MSAKTEFEIADLEQWPVLVLHRVRSPAGELLEEHPAIYAKHVCLVGELLRAEDFRHLDGRTCHSGERVLCGTCGSDIPPNVSSLRFVERTTWPK